jgi:hypothetical protein
LVLVRRRRDKGALGQLMRDHIKSKRAVIAAAYSNAEKPKRSEARRVDAGRA